VGARLYMITFFFFVRYTGQNGASLYLYPTLLRRIRQRGATVDTPFCPGLSKEQSDLSQLSLFEPLHHIFPKIKLNQT
jgi:hypothetical protein